MPRQTIHSKCRKSHVCFAVVGCCLFFLCARPRPNMVRNSNDEENKSEHPWSSFQFKWSILEFINGVRETEGFYPRPRYETLLSYRCCFQYQQRVVLTWHDAGHATLALVCCWRYMRTFCRRRRTIFCALKKLSHQQMARFNHIKTFASSFVEHATTVKPRCSECAAD